MFDQEVTRLTRNFSLAFQNLKTEDFFSLQAFKNRYQATLVVLGYATAIPLAPVVLDVLVGVLGAMLHALSMTSYLYSAFHFLKFIYLVSSAPVGNPNDIKREQEEALTQAFYGFFIGCSLESLQMLSIIANQFFTSIVIAVMGYRIFEALPESDVHRVDVGPIQATFRLRGS
jgi:hypothetical protein